MAQRPTPVHHVVLYARVVHGLGWVGLGRYFSVFGGLGWVTIAKVLKF